MTSFNGVDLATKHRRPKARRKYLPIAPCDPHPDNGIILHLEDSSLCLRKSSYINTKDQRTIELHSLRTYSNANAEYFLSEASYHKLIRYANFVPPLPAMPQVAEILVQRALAATQGSTSSIRDNPTGHPSNVRYASIGSQALNMDGGVRQTRTPRSGAISARPAYQPRRVDYLDYLTNGPRVYTTNTRHSSTPSNRYTYGGISVSSRGSEANRPPDKPGWKALKVVFWLFATVTAGYGIYRGGCWTVWAVGAVIEWIRQTVQAATATVSNSYHNLTGGIQNSVAITIEAIKNAFGAARSWVGSLALVV